MAIVGAGYTKDEVNRTLTAFAKECRRVKAHGAEIQAWFDAANGAANNGSNVAARATALKAKMDDDAAGGDCGLTQAEVEVIVAAFDELIYWAATFAPVETLKVSGPTSLI